MDAIAAELHRLIQNLIRLGTIAEVDGDRVRVQSGKITTDWLRWLTHRAGNAATWWQPSVGEQVMILSPAGDLAAGIVLPAIYSDAHPAPEETPSVHTTHYPDGAVVSYDFATHALEAALPGGGSAVLTAPGSVTVNSDAITLNAPQTTCTGQLLVKQLITGQGGIAISDGAGGGATATISIPLHVTKDITTDKDVKAGNISLQGHHHTEQGDGAPTSAAQA